MQRKVGLSGPGRNSVNKHSKHVIIGNSAAGLSAIRAIRKMGDSRPIVLISAENCNAYSPVLTTYFIADQISRSDLFVVKRSFYQENGVQTIFGQKAVAVDPAKHTICLANRSKLNYENLLIASGASARSLANVDDDASGYVMTLRTIQDAEKIKATSERAARVVFVGGGLVSLQTIRALLNKAKKITLIVGSDQILSQQLDRESAEIIQKMLEARGILILFGRKIDQIVKQRNGVHVVTDLGEKIEADLVIVGKGVKPNMDMIEDTEITRRNGILVDDRMSTNLEHIFAAGDVAEGINRITGKPELIATWFSAQAQGEIAGLNMAGGLAHLHAEFRENVTTILGTSVVSIGLSKPETGKFEMLRHVDPKYGVYRKLVLDGSQVVGALLVGRIEDAGVIRHCIANSVDIRPWEQEIAAAPLNFGKIICRQNFNWPFLSG